MDQRSIVKNRDLVGQERRFAEIVRNQEHRFLELEKDAVQIFLEAFNLTNMVNWSNGTGNMRSTTFLVSRPGGTARQIQWGGRYAF